MTQGTTGNKRNWRGISSKVLLNTFAVTLPFSTVLPLVSQAKEQANNNGFPTVTHESNIGSNEAEKYLTQFITSLNQNILPPKEVKDTDVTITTLNTLGGTQLIATSNKQGTATNQSVFTSAETGGTVKPLGIDTNGQKITKGEDGLAQRLATTQTDIEETSNYTLTKRQLKHLDVTKLQKKLKVAKNTKAKVKKTKVKVTKSLNVAKSKTNTLQTKLDDKKSKLEEKQKSYDDLTALVATLKATEETKTVKDSLNSLEVSKDTTVSNQTVSSNDEPMMSNQTSPMITGTTAVTSSNKNSFNKPEGSPNTTNLATSSNTEAVLKEIGVAKSVVEGSKKSSKDKDIFVKTSSITNQDAKPDEEQTVEPSVITKTDKPSTPTQTTQALVKDAEQTALNATTLTTSEKLLKTTEDLKVLDKEIQALALEVDETSKTLATYNAKELDLEDALNTVDDKIEKTSSTIKRYTSYLKQYKKFKKSGKVEGEISGHQAKEVAEILAQQREESSGSSGSSQSSVTPKVDIDKLKDLGSAPTLAQTIIQNGYKYIGVPYVWGGTTPNGFDCSGLMQYIFREAGITLPRVARDQQKVGVQIPFSELKAGDLIFIHQPATHVALYIGDGYYLHAPQPGETVKIEKFYPQYWTNAYRVIFSSDEAKSSALALQTKAKAEQAKKDALAKQQALQYKRTQDAQAKQRAEARAKAVAKAKALEKAKAKKRAKAEAKRKAKLEAERKAKLEAERKAKLEQEAKEKAAAEKAKQEQEKEQAEKDKNKDNNQQEPTTPEEDTSSTES